MKKALIFASLGEGATGLALLIVPSLVGQLLLGRELSGVTIVVGRVAGIALIALGIACWPNDKTIRTALSAMLLYGLFITCYLTFLGIRGEWVGPLLWPAVALHVIIVMFLGHIWLKGPP
jgi:hypothetical protein